MNKYLLLFSFLFLFGTTSAQETKMHEKTFYIDSAKKYYQQAELPIFIFISHSRTGAPTPLNPEQVGGKSGEWKEIKLDGHGKHYLKHSEEGRTEDKYAVYASIKFESAPKFVKGGVSYYGKGLMVPLSTKDEMSGVKEFYHSLNQASYSEYSTTMNANQEGEQEYKFYAVDNVGNAETPKGYKFTVDLTAPTTFHNVVGISKDRIISTNTKIYLTKEDKISGVAKTYYHFDDETDKFYKGGIIPFTYLSDGEHTLYYHSIDNVSNEEVVKKFPFYLDKTAPIMSSDVLGDKFIVNDQVYFSGRTKLKLTAVDNKSGVKEVLYSVDGSEFKKYDGPFYLPSEAGTHVIKYYALDNMSNEGAGKANTKYDEFKHSVNKVYVDLTGPTMSHKYTGPTFAKGDTIYLGPETKLQLKAYDPESGLQFISYSIDGATEETTYDTPFNITSSGTHIIKYFGYDNVNNRNVSEVSLVVDVDGPEIENIFSISPIGEKNGMDVYPSYVSIFLAAKDELTGADYISYTLNKNKEVPYGKAITGFKKNRNYTIKVRSLDKLGNESIQEFSFRTEKY
jgi:hypothetical protein